MQASIHFSQVFQLEFDLALTPEKLLEKELTLETIVLRERRHGECCLKVSN